MISEHNSNNCELGLELKKRMAGVGQDVDLTSEEEVQEYLNNLAIEYRFGCYSEKNPKACQLLGEFIESISQDRIKAFQIFESNCVVNNHPPSCNKAGHYKIVGKTDIEPDPDLGYKYLTKGKLFFNHYI